MKAWEIQGNGLENLKLVDRAVPTPGPKQLLVKVSAVSLNFRDKAILAGIYKPHLMKWPFVPVSDAAGVVVGTGTEVTLFKNGDRVTSHIYPNWISGMVQPVDVNENALGGPVDGGLAEFMLLDEAAAIRTSENLTDAESATLPIAALTAWFALVDHGRLKEGQTIVTQGTGGVALFGIQLASALGARVIALSGSDEKIARLESLGAPETINYLKNPEWQQTILELTNGRGADNILNIAGGSTINKSIQATTDGGQISIIGFVESLSANVDLLPVIFGATRINGILVGNLDAFKAMNAAIEKYNIKPVIDAEYTFENAIAAYQHLDKGAFGKIVINGLA